MSGIELHDLEASTGLSRTAAASRLTADGPNTLTPASETSQLVLFLSQFRNGFMLLLLGAGTLSIISPFLQSGPVTDLSNTYLGIILICVVIATCVMSYLQERSSSRIMDSFGQMLPPAATVIRDGARMEVPAADLVKGDVILLRVGEQVPADVRVLASSDLQVEKASLTGESDAVKLVPTAAEEDNLYEATCLALNSCFVVNGSGVGVVVRTGDETVIGKIAALASRSRTGQTTLEREVSHFVRVITVIALTMAVTCVIVGLARGLSFLDVFIVGFLTVIVANVPQGLPATVTSLLAVTAREMAAKGVRVKRLDSVETLGAVSVIASDKTGTLTKNELTVTGMWLGAVGHVTATNGVWDSRDTSSPAYRYASVVGSLCNTARVEAADGNKVTGNAVDIALLLTFGVQHCLQVREAAPIRAELPFNSRTKTHTVVIDSADPAGAKDVEGPARRRRRRQPKKKKGRDAGDCLVLLKGAPEIVLDRCSSTCGPDGSLPAIDDAFRDSFMTAYARYGGVGARVIALAYRRLAVPDGASIVDASEAATAADDVVLIPTHDFVFVGLVAMSDPPRPGVLEAVRDCQSAGIKVMMVTGDHPLTATAIARQVGILPAVEGQGPATPIEVGMYGRRSLDLSRLSTSAGGGRLAASIDSSSSGSKGPSARASFDLAVASCVHGSQIDTLTERQWTEILGRPGVVFARTTPQQKLRIVEECQARGHVVAVTGDGVNDAPALKQADVGVAMGVAGTAVAQEAAAVVLVHDDFPSIVQAIRQGRVLFDNLKKTITYTLSHLWPEVLPVLLSLFGSLPLGLSSIQVLCIDLGTEMAPAISLAHEEADADIMDRPPRRIRQDRLVSWPLLLYAYGVAGVVEACACVTAYLIAFVRAGVPLSVLPGSYEAYWSLGSDDLDLGDGRGILSDEEQVAILGQAQAAWFVTLVMSQFWHIWMNKTARVSLVHSNLFSNRFMNMSVVLEVALLLIIVYVPFVQQVVGTRDAGWAAWLPHLISLVLLAAASELFKARARRALDREACQSKTL
jgi:sodium/potassium-transporting ATPase subunit alpha